MKKTKIKNIEKIALVLLVTALFFNFANSPALVGAISIGISPSEKSIELKEGETSIVYFAVSQGSKETESITISTDADWLKPETESFSLEPNGQKYVKFSVSPLPVGNYTAKIKALTSLPGAVGMKFSATAKLYISVSSSVASPEEEASLKAKAATSISDAQDMVQQVKLVGGDTSEAEKILTSALEEFDKGNYDYAQKFADIAYHIASENYEKSKERGIILTPLTLGLITIGVGASVVLAVILYEMSKSKRGKEAIAKAQGVKCSNCGSTMYLAYDGTLISSYTCSKCGNKEIKEKYGLR